MGVVSDGRICEPPSSVPSFSLKAILVFLKDNECTAPAGAKRIVSSSNVEAVLARRFWRVGECGSWTFGGLDCSLCLSFASQFEGLVIRGSNLQLKAMSSTVAHT